MQLRKEKFLLRFEYRRVMGITDQQGRYGLTEETITLEVAKPSLEGLANKVREFTSWLRVGLTFGQSAAWGVIA